jgi:pimeloyl-ACP methyl ester carboxylesterase
MSKWVVVVPGIMGSSLKLHGDTVWPPGVWDVLTSDYNKVAELMDDDVQVEEIIRNVSVMPVYKTLLQDIEACGYHDHPDATRRRIDFPYDWRRSNSATAQRLAETLDAAATNGLPDEITFVAHSMGGLVVRRLIEGGDYADRTWFERVRKLVTLGTPHFGAPLSIARLAGTEKFLGVAGKDLVRLASDPRYPSTYELAGPPGMAFTLNGGERGSVPKALDRFDSNYRKVLHLKDENITAANEFWSHLDFAKRPSGIEYFMVGGASHSTVVNCRNDSVALKRTKTQNSGDGTVPITSAIVASMPHTYSRKVHARIFEDREVRDMLFVILDAPEGLRPQSADEGEAVGAPGRIGLSVDQTAYGLGEPIEIVGSYSSPIDQPHESLWIEKLQESGPPEAVHSFNIALDAPNISTFSITIGPDLGPGIYELKTSRASDDPIPTRFQVIE